MRGAAAALRVAQAACAHLSPMSGSSIPAAGAGWRGPAGQAIRTGSCPRGATRKPGGPACQQRTECKGAVGGSQPVPPQPTGRRKLGSTPQAALSQPPHLFVENPEVVATQMGLLEHKLLRSTGEVACGRRSGGVGGGTVAGMAACGGAACEGWRAGSVVSGAWGWHQGDVKF